MTNAPAVPAEEHGQISLVGRVVNGSSRPGLCSNCPGVALPIGPPRLPSARSSARVGLLPVQRAVFRGGDGRGRQPDLTGRSPRGREALGSDAPARAGTRSRSDSLIAVRLIGRWADVRRTGSRLGVAGPVRAPTPIQSGNRGHLLSCFPHPFYDHALRSGSVSHAGGARPRLD